jgi:hypothetical protein
MELEEMLIAGQRFGGCVPAEMNTQATTERLLENGVFCWVRPEAI